MVLPCSIFGLFSSLFPAEPASGDVQHRERGPSEDQANRGAHCSSHRHDNGVSVRPGYYGAYQGVTEAPPGVVQERVSQPGPSSSAAVRAWALRSYATQVSGFMLF